MTARTRPPFRADHVGSILRSAAIKDARASHEAGKMSDAELAAIEDREIEKIVKKQEEVGLQLAATYLSQFLLKPESRQELETDPDKLTPVVANLCRLSKEIHKLQKSRDGSAKALDRQNAPERVKRENEELLPSLMEVYGTKKLVSPARPPQKQLSTAPIPPSKEQPKPQP